MRGQRRRADRGLARRAAARSSTSKPRVRDPRPDAFKDVVTGEPDLLVSKTVNSAFYGKPDLDGWLRERGIGAIALCGHQHRPLRRDHRADGRQPRLRGPVRARRDAHVRPHGARRHGHDARTSWPGRRRRASTRSSPRSSAPRISSVGTRARVGGTTNRAPAAAARGTRAAAAPAAQMTVWSESGWAGAVVVVDDGGAYASTIGTGTGRDRRVRGPRMTAASARRVFMPRTLGSGHRARTSAG